MAYNMKAFNELQYKDQIYLPSLRIEARLSFQHENEKNRPQKCRKEMVIMDWSSNESFVTSMKRCIKLLAAKKEEYLKNRSIGGNDEDEDEDEDESSMDEDVDEAKGNKNDYELKHENEIDPQRIYRYWESRSSNEDDAEDGTVNEDDDVDNEATVSKEEDDDASMVSSEQEEKEESPVTL